MLPQAVAQDPARKVCMWTLFSPFPTHLFCAGLRPHPWFPTQTLTTALHHPGGAHAVVVVPAPRLLHLRDFLWFLDNRLLAECRDEKREHCEHGRDLHLRDLPSFSDLVILDDLIFINFSSRAKVSEIFGQTIFPNSFSMALYMHLCACNLSYLALHFLYAQRPA